MALWSWRRPPLSATPTSPPQGGRSAESAWSPNKRVLRFRGCVGQDRRPSRSPPLWGRCHAVTEGGGLAPEVVSWTAVELGADGAEIGAPPPSVGDADISPTRGEISRARRAFSQNSAAISRLRGAKQAPQPISHLVGEMSRSDRGGRTCSGANFIGCRRAWGRWRRDRGAAPLCRRRRHLPPKGGD